MEMRICSVGTGFACGCGLGAVAVGPAEVVVHGGGRGVDRHDAKAAKVGPRRGRPGAGVVAALQRSWR